MRMIVALWCLWLVYWLISARAGKPVERREGSWSRLVHHVPLTLGAVLIAVPNFLGGWLEGFFRPATPPLFWTAVALVAAGLGFAVAARVRLGGNWSGTVTVKTGHELIRSGPYAYVRHPIYSGLLLALLGTALAVGQWRALLGLALIAAGLLRKLMIEERFMSEQFGDAYARYRAEVPALIPFVG
jgi:protein-S-isoprenylcysteine O-methyltransferase Ste14